MRKKRKPKNEERYWAVQKLLRNKGVRYEDVAELCGTTKQNVYAYVIGDTNGDRKGAAVSKRIRRLFRVWGVSA